MSIDPRTPMSKDLDPPNNDKTAEVEGHAFRKGHRAPAGADETAEVEGHAMRGRRGRRVRRCRTHH